MPVTWITGPAGSGKTSLVASYIEARRRRSLWYRVDEGDADLATLFYYLGKAVRTAAPRRRISLPLLTPEYAADSPTFGLRYFEALFSRLARPSLVVLDNYQDLPARAPLHALLARVLGAVPSGLKVVVVSRHAPPPAFARLRGHGVLHVVGWDELQLSLEESRRIALTRTPRGVSRATIDAAHRRAGGWAAGLVMMVEGARRSGTRQPPPHASSGEVFDYFASEVLGTTDPATQDLLLRTAFLPEVTAALADRLTESRQGGRILAELGRSQYFTTCTHDSQPVYQYHPLFREFLMARARQTMSPEALATLLQRAAALLEEAGQAEAAAALLLEARAWEALRAVILRQAPALATQGRFSTLASWIRGLPETVREEDPWLLYWMGVSLLPAGEVVASRATLERAFTQFDARGEEAGRLLTWAGVVDTILYSWDDFSLLDPWIDWLEARFSAESPFETPQVAAAVTTAMMGAIVFRLPAHVDPGPWLTRARQLLREAPDVQTRLRAATYLGLYAFWMGHFPVVREIVEEIRRLSRSPHASPLSVITWQWFFGAILVFDAMAPEACLELTDATLRLAERSGVHMLDFMVLAQGVNASLNFGDPQRARGYLARMAEVAQGRNGHAYRTYLDSWEAFLSGDSSRALARAEEALRLALESGMPFAEALARLALAHLRHDRGEGEVAHGQLAAARRIADTSGSAYFDFACSLAEARFAAAAGEASARAQALRRMLAAGARHEIGSLYWWVPEWITPLCVEALRGGIETDYVCRLVRQWKLVPEAPPYDCPGWPWEVRIRTLGRFEVERDGRPLVYAAKAPRRLLTLLRALVAHGPRGATEERLADLLWPHAEGDVAQQALATSLHRLRRLLGNERTVSVRDGRVVLDARLCWVDAHAFEAQLGSAEDGDLQAVLALYAGPFLPESDEPWAVSFRERLRARFVDAVRARAAILGGGGDEAAAVALLVRSLEADGRAGPLAAEAVRRLRASGRDGEATALERRLASA